MKDLQQIFSQIYDNNLDSVYRFIYFKVNSEEIAQDLCSDVFLRFWHTLKGKENKHKKEKAIKNPKAFLYQIARNLIVDYYRGKAKAQFVSTDDVSIADPRTDPEEEALIKSDVEQIKKLLFNLNEDYREVILLRYVEDLSISEISSILKKKESTVRVLLHRGLKALKKEIKQKEAYFNHEIKEG